MSSYDHYTRSSKKLSLEDAIANLQSDLSEKITNLTTETGLEPRTTQFLNEHSTIWPNWPNDRAVF